MSSGYDLLQQQWKIMEKFDFERVQKTMKALDWKWLGEEPTLEKLKGQAESLLTVVSNRIHDPALNEDNPQWFSASTGGFKASNKLVNGNWRLSLEFIVASYENYYL